MVVLHSFSTVKWWCVQGVGLVVCGDDKGSLWLYNLPEMVKTNPTALSKPVDPTAMLMWPELQVSRLLVFSSYNEIFAPPVIRTFSLLMRYFWFFLPLFLLIFLPISPPFRSGSPLPLFPLLFSWYSPFQMTSPYVPFRSKMKYEIHLCLVMHPNMFFSFIIMLAQDDHLENSRKVPLDRHDIIIDKVPIIRRFN